MSEINLTASELEIKILRQLKENPVSPSQSDAFPTELIFDTMNEIYEEVFNNPRKQIKIRTAEINFDIIADTKLTAEIDSSSTSIEVSDSSSYPITGRIWIDNEFIDYTANDGVNTFTVDAGAIQATHDNGKTVRPCYALPTDIDKEKAQYINIDGLTYDPVDIAEMQDDYKSNCRNFSIHDGYLQFAEGMTVVSALFIYTPKIVRIILGTEIFTLIPNNFRVPLIVNGSVGKLMVLDQQRGYEIYYKPPTSRRDRGGGLFYNAMWSFYASYGRQTDIRNKKTSRSIYD